MKILTTLQSTLSKMEEKEAIEFRDYALCKKEKRIVKLFDVLYKHRETVELEYLLLFIKQKKVDQNLRNNCKTLFNLVLQFWSDNPPEENKNIEIVRLIHGATILIKRGLVKEGLELFKKAKAVSETSEKYSYQYEILRLTSHWSSMLEPKKINKVLSKVEQEAELLSKKMQINLSSNLLAVKVRQSIINCNWAFTEEDQLFFEDVEQEAQQMLKGDLTNRSKFVYHNIIGKVNSSLPNGKSALIEYHTLECIKISKLLYKEDPTKFGPLLMYKFVRLFYLYFSEREKTRFQGLLPKFRYYANIHKDKDVNLEFSYYQIELLNCLLNEDYLSAEKEVIPAALNYLEKNAAIIPVSFNWYINSHCIEIKLAVGKLEEAGQLYKEMNHEEKLAKLPALLKFFNRLFVLLYNYELKNYAYVENAAKSTRRLYSEILKGNPGGKLFISYLIKLCNADFDEQVLIFKAFKKELDAVFQNSFYQKIIGVNLLSDWVSAKASGFETVEQYVTSNTQTIKRAS